MDDEELVGRFMEQAVSNDFSKQFTWWWSDSHYFKFFTLTILINEYVC